MKRGERGVMLYREAKKIASIGKDIPGRCQELAVRGLRAGLSTKQVYRHIARAIKKTLAMKP